MLGTKRTIAAFAAACTWIAASAGAAEAQTSAAKWEPVELSFAGPFASETDSSPNPFLDYRLQVEFTGPSGQVYDVPGFFAGDGEGGGTGSTWRARFSADETGTWTWKASFRQGTNVAVDLAPGAGSPTSFDGASGTLTITHVPLDAEGFLRDGRLEHVGAHYLRFREGRYFLKTGTNGPENLLGFSGFDDVQDLGGVSGSIIHDYAPHVADREPGDPPYGGLIGALNYLGSIGVNAVYFLPMNLGGDAQDTCPFVSYADTAYAKTHYDVSRLAQWNEVFEHAQRQGVLLQFVLSETEAQNEQWLDGGGFGTQRKLFFRELVARFGHVLAIKWNLGEESDFSSSMLHQMADWLAAVDPYDHPIAVHNHTHQLESTYEPLLGDPDFAMTSIQYEDPDAGAIVEEWRARSAAAGHPWVIDMDENIWPGITDDNADEVRKEMMWDILLSGGNLEWYLAYYDLPLGGDVNLEDFRTREEHWTYGRIARELLEKHTPFWLMEPADHLLTGEHGAWGGGEVFAREGRVYVVYLPNASAGGTLDLGAADGLLRIRWYDPRTGEMGPARWEMGGGAIELGTPPSKPSQDWAVLIEAPSLWADTWAASFASGGDQVLELDAGPGFGGMPYRVLGSLVGPSPGTPFEGVTVPLVLDAYFVTTWLAPSSLGFQQGFVGTLDADGEAQATIDLGAVAMSPGVVGLTAWHAYVVGDPAIFASNAVPLAILP